MKNERLFITPQLAKECLKICDGTVHCFINQGGMFIGADWELNKVMEQFEKADKIEIGGENCKSLEHQIVCVPKNAKWQSDLYFFASVTEKVEQLEKGGM